MTATLPHGYVLQGKDQQYTLDRVLGQGSFGITYLAKTKMSFMGQMGSGTIWSQVCIKEFFMRDMNSRDERTGSLRDSSGNSLVERYRRAFLREARNLAKMHHPGIVNVFEVIETNNTAYIVMEYIDGGSLDEYIQAHGRLPEIEALRCFEPLCDAMAYMHAQQMLHLDLKPKNVMRDEEGHLYLIDFGLSKQYTADGEPESSTTIGLGTPGYAPSEQAEQRDGDHSFRATIDIYALGATLYKMLTGVTPPKATEISEARFNDEDIVFARLISADVSADTASICSKAMFPSSQKRYQTIGELMQALGWQVTTYEKDPEVVGVASLDEEEDSTHVITPVISHEGEEVKGGGLTVVEAVVQPEEEIKNPMVTVSVSHRPDEPQKGNDEKENNESPQSPTTSSTHLSFRGLSKGLRIGLISLAGIIVVVGFLVFQFLSKQGTVKPEEMASGKDSTVVLCGSTTDNLDHTVDSISTKADGIPAADEQPSQTGSITINSEPGGAYIYIDGKKQSQKTPGQFESLSVGKRRIKLTLEGYKDETKTINVQAGSNPDMNIKLSIVPEVPAADSQEEAKSVDASVEPAQPAEISTVSLPPTTTASGASANSSALKVSWSDEVTEEQQKVLQRLINNMVFIEGGTFTMGSTDEYDDDASDDERITHQVTLSSFRFGRFEVRQDEWIAVMGTNPSKWQGDDLPVERVSWNDCQEFIGQLNALTGLSFRLPTEAEWEYAARGGKKGNGCKYSGNDDVKTVAWIKDNSGGVTHQVGGKKPNELGLYDMSGNVSEWCSDCYGPYSDSAQQNPTGPTTGTRHVRRGGDWNNTAKSCRVSNRSYESSGNRYYGLGLRLCISK